MKNSHVNQIVIWSQNDILHVKMSLGMCSVSKTESQKHKHQNGTQNNATGLTSKEELFNRSSFSNSETANGLVMSKQVRRWSQILIWSPIDNFTLKSVIFETSPNIGKLYVISKYFSPWVRIQDRYLQNHYWLA